MADIFIINTGGYEVSLGMTWLSKYHAVIDCQNKSVIFRISHQSEFQFVGESKAFRQKQQGVCATTETQQKPKSVVEEFLDVFPEDLPGLLLDRNLEFAIEVILDTAPISKAPYRMAFVGASRIEETITRVLGRRLHQA